MNPVYAVTLKEDTDVVIRIRVLLERRAPGEEIINPDFMEYNVQAALFGSFYKFPPPKGSLNLKSLKNPALETNKGLYTRNMSSAVSEKVKYPVNSAETSPCGTILTHSLHIQSPTAWYLPSLTSRRF